MVSLRGGATLDTAWADTGGTGTVALTRVVDGHVDRQLVTHTAVQTVGAYRHHLDHVAGVGQQVLEDRPLVDRGRITRRSGEKRVEEKTCGGLSIVLLICGVYPAIWPLTTTTREYYGGICLFVYLKGSPWVWVMVLSKIPTVTPEGD